MRRNEVGRCARVSALLGCFALAGCAAGGDPPRAPTASAAVDPSTADLPTLKRHGFEALRAGDPQRAAVFLRAAQEQRSDDPEIAGALGQALAMAGETDAAIEQLQRASELAPQDLRPRGALARVFKNLERYDEASAELRAVLELQPEHRGALGELGDIGFRTHDYAMCAEYFSRYVTALEAEPPGLLTEHDKHLYRRAKERLSGCEAAL